MTHNLKRVAELTAAGWMSARRAIPLASRRIGISQAVPAVVMFFLLTAGLTNAPPARAITLRPDLGSPYPVPGSPGSVAVGDLNGDGSDDLAVESDLYRAGANHGYVSVFLARAGGGFSDAKGSPLSLGPGVYAIKAGDFTGDGKPDLLVVDWASDSVFVLAGRGDGTFAEFPGISSPIGGPVGSPVVGDFNGDGNLDVAVAGSNSSTSPDNAMTILLGRGDGRFVKAAGSPIALGGAFPCCSLTAGHFNGDGPLDLAVNDISDGVGRLTVFLGNGDGTFSPAPGPQIDLAEASVPGSLAVGDFNDDGRSDISVAGDPYSSVSVLLGQGDGMFSSAPASPISLPTYSYPDGSAVADLNDDGKLDIAVTSSAGTGADNGLWAELGDGAGGFGLAAGSPFKVVDSGQVPLLVGSGRFDGRVGVVVAQVTGVGAVSVLLAPLPTDPPTAALTASSDPVLTGQTVKFDASASSDPLDRGLVDYKWDLGNGRFDHDTGATPTVGWRYDTAKTVHVRVLVRNTAGQQAVRGVTVNVRPAPPRGAVGVSINDGDYATNTPHVTLHVVWPAFAATALISNDGGFNSAGATKRVPLTATVPWTLRSAGRERLPKIVYLRYPDTPDPTRTFTDDIILDTLTPVVRSAVAVPTRTAATARSRLRVFRVRLTATERLSGISAAQFSHTRSRGTIVVFSGHRRRGVRKVARVVSVKAASPPRFVRVRSAAGTWSKWARIR